MQSTTEEYEKVAYSYAEEVAYVTILWTALVGAIAYYFLRYANRSLFKWHTVSRGQADGQGGSKAGGGIGKEAGGDGKGPQPYSTTSAPL